MTNIDHHAYNNSIRYLHPAYKVTAAGITIFLVLLLNRPSVSLAALMWMSGLVVGIARIPLGTFSRLLLVEATFLALTIIGVVTSVSLSQPVELWTTQIGPIWLSSSPEMIRAGGILILRALAAVSAMNFLALTTPLVDLIDLLRRWHMPELILDLMTILYRFIFVLLETFGAIYTAQASRLGYHSRRSTMRSASLLGSQLFVNAFQRARRLQTALDSRGYTGTLQVLPVDYANQSSWFIIISAILFSLVGVSLL